MDLAPYPAKKADNFDWHVMVFIVPRQIVPLGNPARCDACESFGAVVKKIIRHLTCRRRVTPGRVYQHRSGNKLWASTFARRYVKQAFRRVCVRAELLHGEDNVAYLQRVDFRLLETGKSSKAKKKADANELPPPTIVESVDAPTWYMLVT